MLFKRHTSSQKSALLQMTHDASMLYALLFDSYILHFEFLQDSLLFMPC